MVVAGLGIAKASLAGAWWYTQGDERERMRNALDAVLQAERTMLAADAFVSATRPRPRGLYGALVRCCALRLEKVRVSP